MKRLTVLLLVLLLLCGCAAEPETTTAPTATTEPTEPTPGLYEPHSGVEEETEGAVRAFLPEAGGFPRICFLGEKLLLLETDANLNRTRITVLEGENKGLGKSLVVEECISKTDGNLWVGSRELAYYDADTGLLVWLDEQLAKVREWALPEGAESPMLSSDLRNIYYCVGNEIHVHNIDTLISRMLKQHDCTNQVLKGIHVNNTVLEVLAMLPQTGMTTLFVSAETGETLGEDPNTWEVESRAGDFMVLRNDGAMDEILLGSGEEPLRNLHVEQEDALIVPLFEGGAILIAGVEELTLYDIQTGMKAASVSFAEVGTVYDLIMDPDLRHVWMLHNDLQTGQTSIFRWDTIATPVEDDQVYIQPRYSAEHPDEEGLKRLEAVASEMSGRYGIRILFRQDLVQPGDYKFKREHHVSILEEALEDLDEALSLCPEGMLKELGKISENGLLTVGLVRDLQGRTPTTTGVQYFVDRNAYVAVKVGSSLRQSIYHELMHALETFVMNRSDAYDDWEDLNPRSFHYYNNYTDYLTHPIDDPLLTTQRCFVDAYAMCSAREDRARILEYAMLEDQEEVFESDAMQKKLRQVCIGIRKAYGWEKESTVYPWEQYLKKPLAKKK